MHHPTVIYLGTRWNVVAENPNTLVIACPYTGQRRAVKVEDVR